MIRPHHTTSSKRLQGVLVFVALCAPGVVLSEVTMGKPGALPVVGRLSSAPAGPFAIATAAPEAVAGRAQYSLVPDAYVDENIAVIHTTAQIAPAAVAIPALPDQRPAQAIIAAAQPAATQPVATTGLQKSPVTAVAAVIPAPHEEVRRGPASITLFADGTHRELRPSGDTVAEILNENHVHVGQRDRVHPARNAAVPANHIIRVERVRTWTQHVYANIAMPLIRRKDSSVARGKERVIAAGARGMRETTIEFTAVDGKAAQHHVIGQRVARSTKARIIAVGTRTPLTGFSEFAARAFSRTEAIAHGALSMIATAYTAYCDTCSGTGRGATGMSVHRGVVAVDPRVIPLGSRLYIPGYGHAIAGDTGGDIVGRRIDLAFDSNAEAIQFGRRPVTIYVLNKKSR